MTILIAVEGIDGAGKGTQVQALVKRLQESGLRCGTLQFPRYSETTFGAAIGDFLNGRFGSLDQVHPQLAAVLYAGDRFESKDVLLERLACNDVVVLDRFTGSNLAHQAAKLEGQQRQELSRWIDHVEHTVFGLPRPNLNILIDISSDWSRQLVSRKAARDYTEQEADIQEADVPYQEKVRRCYLDVADQRSDWAIVNSINEAGKLKSVEDVHNDIYSRIKPLVDHLNPSAN
ncbi:MAG: thymidylate kinase [Fuerstiella sp.]